MTRRAAILTLTLAAALSGCGLSESRLNPFNWFGGSSASEAPAPVALEARVDRRPLVARITALEIERTPGGAIIRVTGLPPEQGWYDQELVSEDPDGEPVNGVLTYSFRARPPLAPTRVSTVQSRELTAAKFISRITLAATREIRVTGAQNSRAARR